MNTSEQERIATLLKKALPPVGAKGITDGASDSAQLNRDLWPNMLRRLQQPPAPLLWFESAWFDWALVAAVAVWLAFFPAAIPVLLYHL